MQIYYQWFDSPEGNLFVAADDKNLRAAVYEHKIDGFDKVFPAAVDQENEIIATTKKQLGEYLTADVKGLICHFFLTEHLFRKQLGMHYCKFRMGK